MNRIVPFQGQEWDKKNFKGRNPEWNSGNLKTKVVRVGSGGRRVMMVRGRGEYEVERLHTISTILQLKGENAPLSTYDMCDGFRRSTDPFGTCTERQKKTGLAFRMEETAAKNPKRTTIEDKPQSAPEHVIGDETPLLLQSISFGSYRKEAPLTTSILCNPWKCPIALGHTDYTTSLRANEV